MFICRQHVYSHVSTHITGKEPLVEILLSVPRSVPLITVLVNTGTRAYISHNPYTCSKHTGFFTQLKPYINIRALFFFNFNGWRIESTNKPCKKNLYQ